MELQLRPYQQEAINSFFRDLPNQRRQLIVLPTGGGKTIVFGTLAKRFNQLFGSQKPILIMAHRDELLQQAEEKLRLVWPDVKVGRVHGRRNETDTDVIIASTQTLVAGRYIPQPSLVIYDECHHGRAEGAFGVLDQLGIFQPDGPVLLGVTATPARSDKNELGDLFENLTYEKTILQLIMDGYLTDVRGIRVKVPMLDLKQIRTTAGGDYNSKDLALILNHQDALNAVVDSVKTYAPNRKSIIFAVDVAHAKALAKQFNNAGIKAAEVNGDMKSAERKIIIDDFLANKIQVLVNVSILTEGFDSPDISCVVIARPTRSQGLYAQMVGRALRLHPGKMDALVLDLTGASDDKALQTFTKLMSTQPRKVKGEDNQQRTFYSNMAREMQEGESVSEWIQRLEQTQRENITRQEVIVQSINLFVNRARFKWEQVGQAFAINYGEEHWAFLLPVPEEGKWWPAIERNREGRLLPLFDTPVSMEYAQGIAEAFLDSLESKLLGQDEDWRNARITQRQSYILDKYRIEYGSTWTRGQANDVISKKFAKRKVKDALKRFDPTEWKRVFGDAKVQQWHRHQLALLHPVNQAKIV
ncbi:DEAD/DEAH box helicase [Alicyclobacillus fodiniaquatilis]|uniref:DEAD/DEAH box helicase n=1 Tax=Alicyclobacillus fodiniaquatilis TaxID=1661150 RepID=A0ABW4JEY5_9BACL